MQQALADDDMNFSVRFTDSLFFPRRYASPDQDGDGMPDLWESHLLGNTSALPGEDPDGDHHSNLTEYEGGSWPTNATFTPFDTVPAGLNAAGKNAIVADLLETLGFCYAKYQESNFEGPYLMPMGVHLKYTPGVGLGGASALIDITPGAIGALSDPRRREVPIHELFHAIQAAYPGFEIQGADWFVEGTARMIQDCFYADLDTVADSHYIAEANNYFSDPDGRSLMARSYENAPFWKFLCEHTAWEGWGTPWYGMDAIRGLLEVNPSAAGVAGLDRYLRGIHDSLAWKNRPFSYAFGAWATALYAHQFNAASTPADYRFYDEEENLPATRLRPVDIHNCLYNWQTRTYQPYDLGLTELYTQNDTNTDTWTQSIPAWSSRYYAFRPHSNAHFLSIWADGENGQRNYYSIVTARGGELQNVIYNFGEDLARAIFNDDLTEVGVVVAGLDRKVNYDLIVQSVSDFNLHITYPMTPTQEWVRIPRVADPSAFVVHVAVTTDQRTPDGDIYVEGLQPELFHVYVGNSALSATILAGEQVGSEYWLICRAPDRAEGDYDLSVMLLDRSDTETNVLHYVDQPHVDRVLVIDRSGSMGSELMGNNEKMLAAKSGARLYADLLGDQDQVGVVSFGDEAEIPNDAGLAQATEAYRTYAKGSIQSFIPDDPDSDVHTALGAGLLTALGEIEDHGLLYNEWRMAVLSDGIEDVEPLWSDPSVSGAIVPTRVKVDTVALGNGAHEGLLEAIAAETGGEYFHVPIPVSVPGTLKRRADGVDPVTQNRVANTYRRIHERDNNYTRVFSEEMTVAGETNMSFRVFQGLTNLILTVNWPSSSGLGADHLELTDPFGTTLPVSVAESSHVRYDLPVISGLWNLRITSMEPVPHLAVLTACSDLKSHLFFTLPEGSRIIGSVQRVWCALEGPGDPVCDAQVYACITTPTGAVERVRLHDNGDRGDGRANDGVYAGDFRWTPWQGTYDVVVVATGSYDRMDFAIEDSGCFLMRDDEDNDGDGLPNDWERRYGLNPGLAEPGKDTDGDGLTDEQEFQLGGNPADEDTDQGGAWDRSEHEQDLNLRNYEDDPVAPPSSLCINPQPTDRVGTNGWPSPASGENLLYWSVAPGHFSVDIHRAEDPSGPFHRIARNRPARQQPYSDAGLTNDITYYYKVRAMTAEEQLSRFSEVEAGTPKADNTRPWGSVKILGPRHITDPAVTLRLAADADAQLMRIDNEADFASGFWEAYGETRAWQIAGAEGANFVYVQFRDAAGNESLVFSDSVMFENDSDFNGLGDEWEYHHFEMFGVDPDGDPDADGLTNKQEFEAGTDPNDDDTDGDGMKDGWEAQGGLDPLLANAGWDGDGDSQRNGEELVAGTMPNDPESLLQVSGATAVTNSRSVLSWLSATGRLYTIRRTADLLGGLWQPVPEFQDRPGTGGRMSYTNDSVVLPQYLRVDVRLP